jgi:fusion and transport protein UGO1
MDAADIAEMELLTHKRKVSASAKKKIVDNAGYVLDNYMGEPCREHWMLRHPTLGIRDTLQCLRNHPNEGNTAMFKGLWTGFVRAIFEETLEPNVLALTCLVFGGDDASMPPVDSDSPTRMVFAHVTAGVLTDTMLAPLDVARTRLIVQSSTHSQKKYNGLVEALRSQFMEYKSTPWADPMRLAATVIPSIATHAFVVATPVILDRVLGVSAIYNPIQYAVMELGFRIVRDLVAIPLISIQTRIFAYHPTMNRNGGLDKIWSPLVPQRLLPYINLGDGLGRMINEEGGAVEERRHRRPDQRTISPWRRLEPLYHGLGLRLAESVIFFLTRVISEFVELDDTEF